MPAISFQRQFLDALLRGDKQQTTRKQTDRIKVGDVCNIYIEQRSRIMDKPMRRATQIGQDMIISKIMDQKWPVVPNRVYINPEYYAHFIGKVKIIEVYDMLPVQCTCGEDAWAKRDGFVGYGDASAWFESKYGEGWVDRGWTVIRWQGWQDRYFEPNP